MSANKARGTAWETALVKYLTPILAPAGLTPRRVAQTGRDDSGDLHGLGPFVGQAKNWRSWEAAIREGLDGAERQRRHAGADYGVAFVKRARRGTAEGYAVMTVMTWAHVLRRMAIAEATLREHGDATLDAYLKRLDEADRIEAQTD